MMRLVSSTREGIHMDEFYFVIIRDHLFEDGDEDNAVGITRGKRHAGRAYEFKLYDDDGILYYTGAGTGEFEEQAWRWGAWYAGSTRLDVDGKVVIG